MKSFPFSTSDVRSGVVGMGIRLSQKKTSGFHLFWLLGTNEKRGDRKGGSLHEAELAYWVADVSFVKFLSSEFSTC